MKRKEPRHTYFLRLDAVIDERLRERTRRHGDLRRLIMRAIESCNLDTVEPVGDGKDRPPTTISFPRDMFLSLNKAAIRRGESINSLVNGAIQAWLADTGGD